MLTNQEFFDKTIRHFVTQGYQSKDPSGDICFYRDSIGGSCAVGCHIPDNLYNENMECNSVTQLLGDFPEVQPFIPNVSLAQQLQYAHDEKDNWLNPSSMVAQLRDVAIDFGLNTAVLDSLDFSEISVNPKGGA